MSGYVPEYLYENNLLSSNGLSFAELHKKAYANDKAKKVILLEEFSRKIRE